MQNRTSFMTAVLALLLVIGMTSVTVMATDPDGQRGSDEIETDWTLSGTVTDGETGIAGAEIVLYGGDVYFCDDNEEYYRCPSYWEWATETGRDGSFEIDLPEGEYSFYVTAEGYMDHYDWIEVYEDTEIEIELTELTAVMTGHVTTEDGDAVADACVSVYTVYEWDDDDVFIQERKGGEGDPTTEVQPWYYFYAYTDDDGFYTLYAVPGEYEVSVWAYGYSSIYEEIELVEGRNTKDFTLEEQTAYVEGWVYGGDTGEMIGGAYVTLEYYPVYTFEENGVRYDTKCNDDGEMTTECIWPGDETIWSYTTETDDDGWFEFELGPEACWMYGLLTVKSEGYKVYETDVFVEEHVQLRIALEPVNGGSGDIVREYEYEYIDENDDGNPEYIYIHETITKGDRLVYEYEYIYKDKDSDGNPEYEYEYETGTKRPTTDPEGPVRDPDEAPVWDSDGDPIFRPLNPGDDGDKDVPGSENTDPKDDGNIWTEGRGDQSGVSSDVHAKGIALVMMIAMVGAAFLFLIRRR